MSWREALFDKVSHTMKAAFVKILIFVLFAFLPFFVLCISVFLLASCPQKFCKQSFQVFLGVSVLAVFILITAVSYAKFLKQKTWGRRFISVCLFHVIGTIILIVPLNFFTLFMYGQKNLLNFISALLLLQPLSFLWVFLWIGCLKKVKRFHAVFPLSS
jgi:hypothetical protein